MDSESASCFESERVSVAKICCLLFSCWFFVCFLCFDFCFVFMLKMNLKFLREKSFEKEIRTNSVRKSLAKM